MADPSQRLPLEQIHDLAARTPVPWGTRPEGPDWTHLAARQIAELARGGEHGEIRVMCHELEHGLGSHRPVDPWRLVTALAELLGG